jgi:cell wall-associated NlpC family hydrolase
VSSHETGRHRAPKSPTPASSFSAAISRSAIPASKASAVILMSGAMVASLALPASAVTPLTTAANTQVAFAAAATPAVPSAAQAPLAPQSFGAVGFVGVVKPKPKPAPVPVVAEPATTVSRSNTRAPISTPTQTAPVAAPASGVVGIAASLAGIYYIYGGTTTAGFDCSGYTQYVFAKAGITLPRTSEEQQAAATPVSNPQPGDLVFFGYPAGHVGIYAGNGMMWDSPHTGASVGLHSVWSTSATYGRF